LGQWLGPQAGEIGAVGAGRRRGALATRWPAAPATAPNALPAQHQGAPVRALLAFCAGSPPVRSAVFRVGGAGL